MYTLQYTGQFKRDLKLIKKRSAKTFSAVSDFLEDLEKKGFTGVDKKYKPHFLSGNYKNCCECHILNDTLLIWIEDNNVFTLKLLRVGSHSDLF